MLIKRVITAGILMPLIVAAIFYLPTTCFAMLAALILSLAAWEWSRLAGLTVIWQRILYVGLLWWGFSIAQLLPDLAVLWIGFIWWLFVIYLVRGYPDIGEYIKDRWLTRCVIGFLVFVPCLQALILLHKTGPVYVLFVLSIIWATDIGAYFIGKKWGERKLAEKVSPGKTIEGLYGGICFAMAVALFFGIVAKVQIGRWLLWGGLVVITIFFAVLGDLFVSVIKRLAGVKDSGILVPGHGGILDRIDSLMAAVPVFALGLLMLTKYLWG